MGMHRDQARRAAGRARIAAAGLAVAGGVVLFSPFPTLDAAPASTPPAPITSDPSRIGPKTAAPFDVERAKVILAAVGPEARPPASTEIEPLLGDDPPAMPTDVVIGDEPPPPTGGPELRYLGPIVGPRRTLAMVALDGQQRMVAVGEMVEGKTVVDVTPSQIILHDDQGAEHIVTMAEKVLDWSMESPAPRGMGSKKFPGPAAKAGTNGEHDQLENEANAMDVRLKEQMEARQAEARRAADERGGVEDNPNSASPPSRIVRPNTPATGAPKTPTSVRGSITPATPPRYPPTRPAVPAKGKTEEKKAGNQV